MTRAKTYTARTVAEKFPPHGRATKNPPHGEGKENKQSRTDKGETAPAEIYGLGEGDNRAARGAKIRSAGAAQ